MSQLMTIEETTDRTSLLPVEPRVGFSVRLATLDDFGWIDAMQKEEADRVGFLPQKAIEKRIGEGNILVAEQKGPRGQGAEGSREEQKGAREEGSESGEDPGLHLAPGPLDPSAPSSPLGYCLAQDRYMKQDHVGQIMQLNIKKEYRRSLVGGALVQATFDKAAYGVKLYGLWCRQDLPANRFWEAMGFLPIAFRAAGFGNQKPGVDPKRKIQIYWQRRVRVGDVKTEYWFPYETQGGLMAESRLVLPIPPGVHWGDVMEPVLPGTERRAEEARMLEAELDEGIEERKGEVKRKQREAKEAAKRAKEIAEGPVIIHGVAVDRKRAANVPLGFDLSPEMKAAKLAEEKKAAVAAERERLKEEKREAKAAAKQARRKTDPELLAFGREFRDRWQEAVTERPELLAVGCEGKYAIGREATERRSDEAVEGVQRRMLEAA